MDPRRREVLGLALPILGGMASQNLLNLVDAWMVGSLGPAALAATGLGGFLNFMAVAFITGFSPAVQAIAARRIGEGSPELAGAPLNGGLLLSVVIGVPLSALLILLAPTIFSALNHDADVVREGVPYLQWRLLSVAAVGINFSFRGYWSAVKQTRFYMQTLVSMHLLNVIFSYGLIHGVAGLPQMGTAGAGLGTTLAVFCGSAMYITLGLRNARDSGFLVQRPDRVQLGNLLRIGLPSSIQQLLFSSGFAAMFWIIGQIGTAELAVANVLTTITLTAILPGIALGISAATLAGQALGRGDAVDAHRWVWDSYRVGIWIFGALALPMLLLTRPVLAVFVHDPAVVELGVVPLRLVGATILLDGLGLIMMQALLGVGASKLVMTVASGLQWLAFLPVAWLLGPVLGFGLTTVWIAMGSYRLIQAAIFTVAWERRSWARISV
ncbi:MATE family efflux transporter [Sinimarinibacterium sp. CAU 1509]|uniref:MATE family efflux transporter n=1 Tax=Sinimarinibacterium sp. CAU 1509 TaxID=2562283 RepID=UPI0010AD1A91|nr:MATE family efflux transporter [Sinimarinibacterium sp. CAU 1509]TJY64731.1 MATE family efflux transporter [Sinimarinibacterium sp. CAU 1509]